MTTADQTSVLPTSRKVLCFVYGVIAVAALIATWSQNVAYGVKYVWLYIAGAFVTAISVVFPLFLIARELRMGTSDAPRLSATDTILLAVVAAATAVWTVWIDVG